MNFGVELLFDVHPWKIIESSFVPEKAREAEACFSLSNEYMGSRGSFEEGSDKLTLEGCYIGGIYVRQPIAYEHPRKAFPRESNFMVHTTNWFRTQVAVDGEAFLMDSSAISDYRRTLDMKRGLLIRELTFTTASGRQTRLRWERFLSLDDRHAAAASLSLTALNHSAPARVVMELDGDKENTHFGNARRHMEVVDSAAGADGIVLLKKICTTGQYFRHQMQTAVPAGAQAAWIQQGARVGQAIELNLKEGQEVRFERTVSVFSSRDAGFPFGLIQKGQTEADLDLEKEQEILMFLRRAGSAHAAALPLYSALRNAHIEAVSKVWKTLDVEVEGDDLSQQGIRFCMFQLFNTYRGFDCNLNIGAKGLTGEVYFGRYFWDTEAYCLPYYLLTNPEAARHLLLCRYNTLDAARERARSFDYDGAWYAWQTIDGTEDLSLNEYAFGEVHINGIVPYAIYFYTKTTGSTELLYNEGIEILIELSRFWASRASYSPYRKGFGILKVMGPDEYQQFINNNFYTNFMAVQALEYTLQTIDRMRADAPDALAEVLGRLQVDEDTELARWKTVAAQMILTENQERGIFVQDDEFFSNEEIHREELDKQRDIPVEKKWTIEKYQKAQLIKQPDVLMAMFLFRDRFSMQQKRDNFRYYEQRTIHGSSLSPSIHSILANEIGRDHMAYEYYLYAARLDLEDYNNNTFEGLHITSLAGTWMNIVFGFGGLCIADDCVQLSPRLPKAWNGLKFKYTYRGELMQVSATHDRVEMQVLEQSQNSCSRFPKAGGTPAVRIAGLPPASNGEPFSENCIECGRGVPVSLYGRRLTVGPEAVSFDVPAALQKRAQMKAVVFGLDGLASGDALPGIADFVKKLRAAGVKIGVFSTRCSTPFMLDKLGISDGFDTIVTGADVEHSKPHPEGFLLAAERLGVAPENCLVVDDAFAGMEAGAAAGMKTMGIGWKVDLYNADYVLKSTKYLTKERGDMLF